ncbi:MAG TPA: hypothetical protein PKO09_05585 [Anaerolineae bacterium]|nr:hypothetical protein [Anaerolineae bacterium]
MKKIGLWALALLLLALALAAPWAVRHIMYHQGGRVERVVARPDLSAVEVTAPARATHTDVAVPATAGAILVDSTHDNLFDPTDLSLLQERVAARGQRLEVVVDEEELPAMLRYAKALIVISPLTDWSTGEAELVERFVGRGGRLLLVSDAAHYTALYDDWGWLVGLDHDAPHLNSLAARFGLQFQPDYLYNLEDNANNYRNVKLRDLAEDALTAGIDELVFFGTRSIQSQAPGLVVSGEGTVSNSDDRVESPSAAVLAADREVLALGDLTFLTEPYNGIAGNDLFVSHIADFLSQADRTYAMDEFPYFFGDRVDLVYTADPLLDSDLLPASGDLQTLFLEAGKALVVEVDEEISRDTLFLGLYGEADDVEEYLAAAQVTLYLRPEEGPEVESWLDYTSTLTATEEFTSRIEVASMGPVVTDGTALFLHSVQEERQVVIVLADTVPGLQAAVARLLKGNLEGCLLREGRPGIALCSTGELEEGDGTGGWPKPEDLDLEDNEDGFQWEGEGSRLPPADPGTGQG